MFDKKTKVDTYTKCATNGCKAKWISFKTGSQLCTSCQAKEPERIAQSLRAAGIYIANWYD